MKLPSPQGAWGASANVYNPCMAPRLIPHNPHNHCNTRLWNMQVFCVL